MCTNITKIRNKTVSHYINALQSRIVTWYTCFNMYAGIFQYFNLLVCSIPILVWTKYLDIDFKLVQCILPSCISYLYTIPPKRNIALASEIQLGDYRLRAWHLFLLQVRIFPVYCRMKTRNQSRCLALLISDQPITNISTHRNSDCDTALGQ